MAAMMPGMPQPRLCAPCLIASNQWTALHKGELERALLAARRAVEQARAEGRQPTQDELNLARYLPEELREQMPNAQPAVTAVNGTEMCAQHVPGGPGKPGLLVANGPLTPAAATQLAPR
jgi:hypothetical protein